MLLVRLLMAVSAHHGAHLRIASELNPGPLVSPGNDEQMKGAHAVEAIECLRLISGQTTSRNISYLPGVRFHYWRELWFRLTIRCIRHVIDMLHATERERRRRRSQLKGLWHKEPTSGGSVHRADPFRFTHPRSALIFYANGNVLTSTLQQSYMALHKLVSCAQPPPFGMTIDVCAAAADIIIASEKDSN